MDTRWTVAALAAVLLSACGGDASEASASPDAAPTAPESGAAAAETTETQENVGPRVTEVPAGSRAGDAMILGNPDSPVKIVEYASVTCPGCATFHAVAWPFVDELAVDPGLVSFEYREFPTSPQNLAYAGFYLARCSATNNGPKAYFRVLDTLYERQMEWAYGNSPADVLGNIAAQVGIDRKGLEDCFFRPDIKEAVTANVKTAVEQDVRGTPTFKFGDETVDWRGSPLVILNRIEKDLLDAGQTGIAAGAEATINLPIDMCDSMLKNTEKAIGGLSKRGDETDELKTLRVSSPDGGSLVATCSAPSPDVSSHSFTIAKVAAE